MCNFLVAVVVGMCVSGCVNKNGQRRKRWCRRCVKDRSGSFKP